MNGFSFEMAKLGRTGIGEDEMADVDIGANAWMGAVIDEACHGLDAVQEAQTKRLEFERDIDLLFIGVIANPAAGFKCPIPLRFGRDDFALPHVLAENEQNIFGLPGSREIDEAFGSLDMELAHRTREIDKTE